MMSKPTKPPIDFDPVVLRKRHDGWTIEKQIDFIQALAETANVEAACRRVGMSDSSAYRLRHQPSGASFRKAWDAAVDYSAHRLEQAAMERALNGVPRPIFFRGEQVGEWREFDENLTMFLLSRIRSQRFGRWIDRKPPPELPPEDDRLVDNTAITLDGRLTEIEFSNEADFAGDDFLDPYESELSELPPEGDES